MPPRLIELGSFRITLVREDIYWWDGGAMFGVVPKTLWAVLAAGRSEPAAAGFQLLHVETGEHTILLDTGGGDKMDGRARERMKLSAQPIPLPQAIAAHGIDPERIDIVINSHLHWDHCGWNTILTKAARSRRFPKRPTTRGAANGSMPTSGTCATGWLTSTPITIRWSRAGACGSSTTMPKLCPASGCGWRPAIPAT